MVRLRCPFPECNCAIVELDESREASLPTGISEKLRLMLPSKHATSDGLFTVFEDIWDFDNIGVSRAISEGSVDIFDKRDAEKVMFTWRGNSYVLSKLQKYLICADCDRGPLGVVCEVRSSKNSDETLTLNMLSLRSVKQAEK
ncbi:LAME_0C05050g1_1 [Lachancea meyersii CBS 8951]|uniref:LAME_0C05050g1_1 n=1 Tax=Lachancea meyersii CBS 8951 TaxID=1266667 RepID=A0A1G4J1W6_9SACH|nr:LAME_0C05050g1_1 [Lachancea meyersii CBS 8951]